MLKLVTDVLLKPYFDEKLRAFKYQQYFSYADRRLKKGKKGCTAQATRALGIMAELARNYPHRLQEVIDSICRFIREEWKKDRAYDAGWDDVVSTALSIVSSFPKKDPNGHPYYVELTQIRLRGIPLKGINFSHCVLWETEFDNVNMTRSSFAKADLGGCQFMKGTSVEWSDFTGALMNVADDHKTTTFDRTRLWGCTMLDARIDKCKMIICDDFDPQPLRDKFENKLEVEEVDRDQG